MKHDTDALVKAWDWSEIFVHDRAMDKFARRLSDVFAVSAALVSVAHYYQSDVSTGAFLATGTLATVSAGYIGKKIAKPIYRLLRIQ